MARVPNPAILALGGIESIRPHGIAASVTRAPSDTDDTLDVSWTMPTDDGDEIGVETACKWTRRGTALPAVDDDALLLIDSRGDPRVICW